jgi:hypothetical protein
LQLRGQKISEDIDYGVSPQSGSRFKEEELTVTIIKNGQDARSTRRLSFLGMGKMPVHNVVV